MEPQTKEKTENLRGPGMRLRLAREASSLTQTTIAKELKLTADIIAAIEADDYTRINNFTFVRGYLRSYSKLMKLPSDEIVGEFNQLGLFEEKSGRAVTVDITKHRMQKKLDSKIITYSVSAAFVAILVLWLFFNRSSSDNNLIIPLSDHVISELNETQY